MLLTGKVGAATGTFLVETTDARSIRASIGKIYFIIIIYLRLI